MAGKNKHSSPEEMMRDTKIESYDMENAMSQEKDLYNEEDMTPDTEMDFMNQNSLEPDSFVKKLHYPIEK
jgi:hypothetical protein